MEEIEDFPGQCLADPGNRGQVGQAGARHGAGGTEMLEKGAFSPRPPPRNFVQRIGPDGGAALLAMPANDKAMRFVTQPLQIVENRAFGIQAERFLTRQVEM